jgi:hypothetical protein
LATGNRFRKVPVRKKMRNFMLSPGGWKFLFGASKFKANEEI